MMPSGQRWASSFPPVVSDTSAVVNLAFELPGVLGWSCRTCRTLCRTLSHSLPTSGKFWRFGTLWNLGGPRCWTSHGAVRRGAHSPPPSPPRCSRCAPRGAALAARPWPFGAALLPEACPVVASCVAPPPAACADAAPACRAAEQSSTGTGARGADVRTRAGARLRRRCRSVLALVPAHSVRDGRTRARRRCCSLQRRRAACLDCLRRRARAWPPSLRRGARERAFRRGGGVQLRVLCRAPALTTAPTSRAQDAAHK